MQEIEHHSFEAGIRGKPDELESQIAQLIGAYFLDRDSNSRFDIRVHGYYDHHLNVPVVDISGEISHSLLHKRIHRDIARLAQSHYNVVHALPPDKNGLTVHVHLTPQSNSLAKNGSAGDSGNPIAVAVRKGPLYLPPERYVAVELRNIVDEIFQHQGTVPCALADTSGIKSIPGLRADGKIGVECTYGKKEYTLQRLVLAVEHEPSLNVNDLRHDLGLVVGAYLDRLQSEFHLDGSPQVIINGLGDWNTGGWKTDAGSREAKPYRDGFSSHGTSEDSFSGEDASKPSATGTLLARFIAVQVIGNKIAEYAKVSLSYSIGDRKRTR